MQKFIGTGVALITPFKEDLSVDINVVLSTWIKVTLNKIKIKMKY